MMIHCVRGQIGYHSLHMCTAGLCVWLHPHVYIMGSKTICVVPY